jgi:hypothetical protein
MGLAVVRFLTLLLAAVAPGAGPAQPNKIHLSHEDYLVAFVSQIFSILVKCETCLVIPDDRQPV